MLQAMQSSPRDEFLAGRRRAICSILRAGSRDSHLVHVLRALMTDEAQPHNQLELRRAEASKVYKGTEFPFISRVFFYSFFTEISVAVILSRFVHMLCTCVR